MKNFKDKIKNIIYRVVVKSAKTNKNLINDELVVSVQQEIKHKPPKPKTNKPKKPTISDIMVILARIETRMDNMEIENNKRFTDLETRMINEIKESEKRTNDKIGKLIKLNNLKTE